MTTSASKPENGLQYLLRAKSPPTTASNSSAITGANLAFSASSRSASAKHANSYSGTNGALAAAGAAGKEKRSFSKQPGASAVHKHVSSREINRYPGITEANHVGNLRVAGNDLPESQQSVNRRPSPSHVAALLAVSKSTFMQQATKQTPLSVSSRRPHMARSRSDVTSSQTPDIGIASDAPTKDLVAMFESMGNARPNEPSPTMKYTNGQKPRVISPIPVRPAQVRTSFSNAQAVEPSRSRPAPSSRPASVKPRVGTNPPAPKGRKSSMLPPPPRKQESVPSVVDTPPQVPRKITPVSSDSSANVNPPPDSLPALPQRSTSGTFSPVPSISKPSPLSLPHRPSPLPSSYLQYRRSSSSIYDPGPTSHAPEPTLNLKSLTPQLTADSLAKAMVPSALASSRAASPSKSLLSIPPALPPPRKSRPTSLFHQARSSEAMPTTRVASPGGVKVGMSKQTFRTLPLSSEDASGKRHGSGKNHRPWKKKHPNKHHEGDRKRWKDEINERERKRYEGLWAANKGILFTLPPPPRQSQGQDQYAQPQPQPQEMMVHPLIVKDIWRRSKLPDFVLEEIWELVTTFTSATTGSVRPLITLGMHNDGDDTPPPPPSLPGLNREAFVVGTWLIDQKLKGRKLPNKVGESVWGSVRGMNGVRIPSHHNRKGW